MIWRRLKKASKEDQEAFSELMSSAELTFKDKLAMAVSAFLVLVLPSLAVLGIIALLILWIFGGL